MSKPKHIKVACVDGDVIAYRSSWATEDFSFEETKEKIDELMAQIIEETVVFPSAENLVVYLTGEGNYRKDLAVTAPYKGNRKETPKPKHLEDAREYLQLKWNAEVVDGKEADDACATMVGQMDDPYDIALVTVDKDFQQVATWHYNNRRNEWVHVEPWDGMFFMYTQILTGDSVDNIIGLHRVGPKGAEKLLWECKDERELFDVCVATYEKIGGGKERNPLSHEEARLRVIENANLVFLQREEGKYWEEPPVDNSFKR